MTSGGELNLGGGIKIWWGESTGEGIFLGEGMSKFWVGAGISPSPQ